MKTGEIFSCDSSSEAEMDINHVPLHLQTTLLPKPKRGKQHFLEIIMVEQLHIMSLEKVQDQKGLQNLIAPKNHTSMD